MRALKFQQLGNTPKLPSLTGRPNRCWGETLVITETHAGYRNLNFFRCAVNIRANKYVKAGYSDDSHLVTCCIIYSDIRIINEGMLHVHLSSLSE